MKSPQLAFATLLLAACSGTETLPPRADACDNQNTSDGETGFLSFPEEMLPLPEPTRLPTGMGEVGPPVRRR